MEAKMLKFAVLLIAFAIFSISYAVQKKKEVANFCF
jgi:hypothetical protein